MKRIKQIILFCSAVLMLSACGKSKCESSSCGPDNSESASASLSRSIFAHVGPISERRPTWSGESLEQDTRGERAFDALRDLQNDASSARKVQIAVYELEAPSASNERGQARAIAQLGFPERFAAPANFSYLRSVESGDLTFSTNTLSGSERYVDHSRFHRSASSATLLADDEYVRAAREYVDGVRLSDGDSRMSLYPYKLRKYKSASRALGADGVAFGPTEEHVDQIAVAFSQELDGLPVIGPGGKLAVHMTLEGDVVSYEASLRRTSRVVRVLSAADLVSPDDAEAEARSRLTERGVDLSQYRFVRSIFGYYRFGRSSIQTVVAPYYSFLFEPLEGVMGRAQLENIVAVRDREVLARIADDSVRERERKNAFGPPMEADER